MANGSRLKDLPLTVLGELRPALLPRVEIVKDSKRILVCGDCANAVSFNRDAVHEYVLERFDGSMTLGAIAQELAALFVALEGRALDSVCAIFLTLVNQGLCAPRQAVQAKVRAETEGERKIS